MNIVWRKKRINKENVLKISEKLKNNLVVASIIDQLGVSYADLDKYLTKNLKYSRDTYLLPDILDAAKRIIQAIEKKEKILIYGDYDVDGFSSTAIIYLFLKEMGADPSYIIPCRLTEGYGLNMERVNEIIEKKVDLVITVDTGIKAIDEIQELTQNGIDVVVTDHHEVGDKIPKNIPVVNPMRKDSKYGFKGLSGSAVIYKVVEIISKELKLKKEVYEKYIEFAALGVISDVMPLVDENRLIVGEAIRRYIKGCSFNSLKMLFKDLKDITSENIAFYIVPKLNSSGRMGKNISLDFLVENDLEKLEDLKLELERLNSERKNIVDKISIEIIEKIEKEKIFEDNFVIIGGKDYHVGVLGIVAAKISKIYSKPTIIYSYGNDKIAVGSGRTFGDVPIYDIIKKAEKYFTAFGGHSLAIGCSFKIRDLEKIKKILNENFKIPDSLIIEYNGTLDIKNMNLNLAKSFKILEPYGEKNKKPIFLFNNIFVKEVYKYNKLTKYIFEDENKKSIVGIDFSDVEINKGEKVILLANIEINNFLGKNSVELKVVKIKKVSG